jgi:hypothetical protein
MWVVRRQGTETSQAELQELIARAICHVLLDQLPAAALGELLPSMFEFKEFYELRGAETPSQPMTLLSGRAMKRAGRTVRPEVVIEE